MGFDAVKIKDGCVAWIQDYFKTNGPTCNAVIGISGGKDSTIVAALCVAALGRDRVIGVRMPYYISDADLDVTMCDAEKVISLLGIRFTDVEIGRAVSAILNSLSINQPNIMSFDISENTKINLPARIRMATLFAVSQSCNGRVANTCNLSEDWVGYSTLFGDGVGQFAPLSRLTVEEVRAVGYVLGLPKELIEKVPSDGLCGKTDEDNLGFTYHDLDTYIRTGNCQGVDLKERIDKRHWDNTFKLLPMPCYDPQIEIKAEF